MYSDRTDDVSSRHTRLDCNHEKLMDDDDDSVTWVDLPGG